MEKIEWENFDKIIHIKNFVKMTCAGIPIDHRITWAIKNIK